MIIGASVGGVENVTQIIMLIEPIVFDVIKTGSAQGTRECITSKISSREEQNTVEERREEVEITTEGEEETTTQ